MSTCNSLNSAKEPEVITKSVQSQVRALLDFILLCQNLNVSLYYRITFGQDFGSNYKNLTFLYCEYVQKKYFFFCHFRSGKWHVTLKLVVACFPDYYNFLPRLSLNKFEVLDACFSSLFRIHK